MQQMYDMWLTMTNQNRPPDDTLITQHIEEKQIVMPTDYAEPMVSEGTYSQNLFVGCRTQTIHSPFSFVKAIKKDYILIVCA